MTYKVGECGLNFDPDELEGYECSTIQLTPEDDGTLVATLVRKVNAEAISSSRPAVLYVHGFVDYFFQTWLADAFETAGYRFYAIDLRRYGRSLRPENRPNYAAHVSDYFEELDIALEEIKKLHGSIAGVVAHSTGALIASLFLKHGKRKTYVKSLVTNSAFLHFALGRWPLAKLAAVHQIARFWPRLRLPDRISGSYGKTIHQSEQGEWNYDLSKKPLNGFPLYAGWFRMIRLAHEEVARGLDLSLPILSLFSSQSRVPRKIVSPEDFVADLVLNVNDIRLLSPALGSNLTITVVEEGLHDLTLSKKAAREFAISSMVSFISEHTPIIEGRT